MRERGLPVLGTILPAARVNVDGALVVHNSWAGNNYMYSQLFRNGFFETVKVLEAPADELAVLKHVVYERNCVALVRALRDEYAHLGIGTEMTCMVSLLGANRVELGITRWRYNLESHQGRFDRHTLVLPDLVLPAELDEEQALRPVFDLVWQAAGLPCFFNYDQEG